jgi:hypothetical protein
LAGKRPRSIADCFRAIENSNRSETEKAEPSTSVVNKTSPLFTFKRRKSSSSSEQKFELSERTSLISKVTKDTHCEAQNSRKIETVSFNRKLLMRRSKEKRSPLEESQDPHKLDDVGRHMNGGDEQMKFDFHDSQDPFAFDEMDIDVKSQTILRRQPKRERSGRSKPLRQEQIVMSSTRLDAAEDGNTLEKSDSVEVSASMARNHPEGEMEASKQSTLLGDCLLSGVKVCIC